jgi:uncharacterized protein (DUF58 family)
MLTSRGWWFLLVVLLLLAIGVVGQRAALALLGLTLLCWFCGQWLLFAIHCRLVLPGVTLERKVCDERGPVETLWAGRTFEVRATLRLSHWLPLPHVAATDWVPFGVEHLEGDTQANGPLSSSRPLGLAYRVRCPTVGSVRFEGVRLHLADFQGFFFQAVFVPGVVRYRMLPVLVDERGHSPTSKRHNLLPPPGVHRMRRPGSGSELLDLRDYLPGDPPKTIAWKVSARRDRLITKEFESEVPLRCTLFVDTANSVRLGPAGKNALARLVHISAAVAQANAAVRDLTGLCLFDEAGVRLVLRPARTPRHLTQVIGKLTDAAALAPTTGAAPVATLLPLAYAFAEEIYPQLLRPEVNRVPFWLPWLWALPAERARVTGAAGHLFRWLIWGLSLLPLTLIALVLALVIDLSTSWAEPPLLPPPLVPPVILFAVYFLGLLLFYPDLLVLTRDWLTQVVSWQRRRLVRWRKQLAALMSARYGLGPGGLALLLEDDEECSRWLQHFLGEHQVPYALPYYDAAGRYLFRSPGKVDVLGRALLAAIGKGHDNEMFVLLVDLLELGEDLAPLLRSVRVALARHHQVVVVCPWPPGIPPPGQEEKPAPAPAPARPGHPSALLNLLERTTTQRFHRSFQHVRQTFARLGVPVVCAASDEPVPLILDRLERMRMLGRKR